MANKLKWAAMMYGLTLSLKNEIVKITPRGRVNCVAPGWVRTPMAGTALQNPSVVYQALATYVHEVFPGAVLTVLLQNSVEKGSRADRHCHADSAVIFVCGIRTCYGPGGDGRRRHGRTFAEQTRRYPDCYANVTQYIDALCVNNVIDG